MGFRSPDLLGLGLPAVPNVREIVVDRTTLKDRDIENMLLDTKKVVFVLGLVLLDQKASVSFFKINLKNGQQK